MRRISEEDVKHVAGLARLNFSAEELRTLTDEFNRILQYLAKLNQVDTMGAPPTAHVLKVKNRFREDTVEPSLPRAEALKNASAVKDGSFQAPQIME
ncbi:MAG TPA: Asp-tRNA(Asn)/Glu-tRNA(Gln) amidotransferase subunit GatC [Bacillota bacterium]